MRTAALAERLETPAPAPAPAPPPAPFAAGAPVQFRVSTGAAAWLRARSEATGRSRSDLLRQALRRLDRYRDAYSARPELRARSPWLLDRGSSTRAAVRLTPDEREAAEDLAALFAGKRCASSALRLAVFIAAAEQAALTRV